MSQLRSWQASAFVVSIWIADGSLLVPGCDDDALPRVPVQVFAKVTGSVRAEERCCGRTLLQASRCGPLDARDFDAIERKNNKELALKEKLCFS